MKRIALLIVLSMIAILSTVEMRGENTGGEDGSIRSCYSSDSTMVYLYYRNYLVVRQAGKPKLKQPIGGWPYVLDVSEEEAIRPWMTYREKHLEEIKEFRKGEGKICFYLYFSVKTGQLSQVEVVVFHEAVKRVDEPLLRELLSIYKDVKLKARIVKYEPCEDDDKYMAYIIHYR